MMLDEVIPPADDLSARPVPRSAWSALKRGLRGRCPACGEGRILRTYLTVNCSCSVCGEEFYHHRADDFPPYITIFVVGHILGALMFAVDDAWPDLPITFHYVTWPVLCIVLSLWLLPIFKGGLIAYQWALRMHGFETAHAATPRTPLDQAKPIPQQSAA
jgi:uncharacterized protein (DUF983 family)